MGDLPEPKQPRCALISGRTADNPRLFKECIDAKCSTVILEKPGAPTVSFVLETCVVLDGGTRAGGAWIDIVCGILSWCLLIILFYVIISFQYLRLQNCNL